LIYFGKNIRMVYLAKRKSGGNGDIKKCPIEGGSIIHIHCKFAAKMQKCGT
jgi:hypothetical protein